MLIKLADLLDIEKPLAELMGQPLPLKLSYKLGKLIKTASDEMKEFYRLRELLFKKLGKGGKEGKIEIEEDKKERFTQELTELAETEIDLRDFEPISISLFDNTDIKMTPIQMSILDKFFKD